MAYEWYRFASWLAEGQNAAAVQAIAAILASIATIILVFITAWYAYITRGILKASHNQLGAVLQPDLKLDLVGNPGRKEAYVMVRVKIENHGQYPVTLENGKVSLGDRVYELPRVSSRVISPGNDFLIKWCETPLPNPPNANPNMHVPGIELSVICSDMSGFARHEFLFSRELGQRYRRICENRMT